MKPISIRLTPYEAFEIMVCIRYTLENNKTRSLSETEAKYKEQVYSQLTQEQLDDANAEYQVNVLIGKYP